MPADLYGDSCHMSTDSRFTELLACPRCDKTPLTEAAGRYSCDACKISFPDIAGIPWLFAEPEASLAEWRGRLHFELQTLAHDSQRIDQELKSTNLLVPTRQRLELQRSAATEHRA